MEISIPHEIAVREANLHVWPTFCAPRVKTLEVGAEPGGCVARSSSACDSGPIRGETKGRSRVRDPPDSPSRPDSCKLESEPRPNLEDSGCRGRSCADAGPLVDRHRPCRPSNRHPRRWSGRARGAGAIARDRALEPLLAGHGGRSRRQPRRRRLPREASRGCRSVGDLCHRLHRVRAAANDRGRHRVSPPARSTSSISRLRSLARSRLWSCSPRSTSPALASSMSPWWRCI